MLLFYALIAIIPLIFVFAARNQQDTLLLKLSLVQLAVLLLVSCSIFVVFFTIGC
ncbi:hypothetical protein [Lactobacillus corticis]|uniref:hypothetical protein n=1 Tax=Lactobacillus corticis TaxID=2201249 RepID=UPI001BB2E058|nr:hypothetical protein [Lactobacillus corticis]